LRAKRRRSDRLAADGGLALRLMYQGRLDWTAMIGYLAQTATPGVEHVCDDTYRRTVLVDGDPGVLEMLPGGDDHLVLRAHLPHWGKLLHIVRRARHVANLDSDPAEGVRILGRDPIIGRLVQARPGVRIPGAWDAFETGVRALIARQGTPSTIRTRIAGLVERYGRPVAGLGELGLTHLFPEPRVLATHDLTNVGVSPTNAAAVRSWAAATVDDASRFERGPGLRQTLAKIGAIAGVSTQTAHYVAFRLGEPDAFPLSNQQLIHRLALPDGSTRDAGAALSDRWRPWRALAVAHLWTAGRLPEEIAQQGAA
jgi:AraC family transcriptional regulator of adaptative response / DNA-3-methyladenine glycosylase II